MKLTLESLPMYCQDCGDCLRWAQGVNNKGYPQANLDGKPTMVRRYVFTELMGLVISPKCVVSSRCSDRMCVAPEHLIAMRRGAVQKRAYEQGRRMHAAEYGARLRDMQRRGKTALDWPQVREIRARDAKLTHGELAREYGVSRRCISDVRRGITWRMSMPASSVFALGSA